MKFIDLDAQQKKIRLKIQESFDFRSWGSILLGPEVSDLEQQLAKYVGKAIALHVLLALMLY